MDPNEKRNKSLSMLEICNLDRKVYFQSCSLRNSCFEEDGKRPDHAHFTLVENECIKRKTRLSVAPKHNSVLKTFPYAIQKHLAMYQPVFTCK